MEEKLPEFFASMLEEQYGNKISKEIIEGYLNKRKVTFRVNTLKTTVQKVEKQLQCINHTHVVLPTKTAKGYRTIPMTDGVYECKKQIIKNTIS